MATAAPPVQCLAQLVKDELCATFMLNFGQLIEQLFPIVGSLDFLLKISGKGQGRSTFFT